MQLQSLQRSVRAQLPSRIGDRLDKVVSTGSRLRRLVDQLLDVSRLTAGGLRLEPERVDLSKVVREIVGRVTEDGAGPGPVVVRAPSRTSSGRWDHERVEQAIEKLVENALKYGQGKPVEIELRTEGGEVVLQVIDHGVGIDEEHQKRIFERFERAVATRDFGGLGLGLWIARRVVEASGGRIAVRSTPGKGSVFTVWLPIDPGGEESCTMPARKGPVLVVDDDADMREAVRDTLSEEGYEAHVVAGGQEALAYLRAHPLPPLILLDWNMAPMNGARFMDELGSDSVLSSIPVVLLTADARAAANAAVRGFVGCLTKPVDLDVLFALVGQHCG